MSRITSYRVIQSEGNRGLAHEVQKAINEGWEPHGSVILVGTKGGSQPSWPMAHNTTPDPPSEIVRIYAQPMVKREADPAELKRLRDMEAWIAGIVEQLDNPCTNELGMLTFAHEKLEAALRGGPFERKG